MQLRLDRRNRTASEPLHVRIGIALGDVVPEDGDWFGTAVVEAVRPLGLEIRAGVHTGEVEILGDKVAGIAVNIAARVAGSADSGEVLVSATVRDLVAGSGLTFEPRGETVLKGIPGSRSLYAVEA